MKLLLLCIVLFCTGCMYAVLQPEPSIYIQDNLGQQILVEKDLEP